ncbi:MAG: ribbon-helix-helix domain-containing protein [Rhodospirillales bacterium]|nr:ribbon-helix-helix domain-containing protein [Alphaproteobacteria bacterium]MCB9986083.1 ribbon-helix-helix domain-containing protein [Rhodospirillales bacterium]USO07351.1 MAG: ribbon-helix-helix domain-containing protein [Rhodospirillales bacterium]
MTKTDISEASIQGNTQKTGLETGGASSSALVSRNITVLGKRTSIRLESQMWVALKEIATREHCSIHDLCSLVASRRKQDLSLTASIRIFLMLYFKAAATEDGHNRAGHGGLDRMIGRLMPQPGRPRTVPPLVDGHDAGKGDMQVA